MPIEGNPMKAVRRDIIQRGTIGLLKYLKSRLSKDEIAAIHEMGCSRGTVAQDISNIYGGPSTSMPDKYAMQKMLTMDLSKRELEIIPGEVVTDAVEVSVQRINLSNNRFRYMWRIFLHYGDHDQLLFSVSRNFVHKLALSLSLIHFFSQT